MYLLYFRKRSHGEKYFISQGIGTKCDICNKLLLIDNLWSHKRTHHNYKLVQCPQCGVTIKDFYLKKHIENKHEGHPGYSCEKCDKTYKDFQHFKFHLVAQHNDTSLGNKKVFTCEYCRMKCRSPYFLENHIKRVHGE